MTLTIELTSEQAAALQEQAAEAGLEASQYVKDLIEQALPMPPMTPAQAIEYWEREGVIGSYGDPNTDSPELARQLRNTVWAGTEKTATCGWWGARLDFNAPARVSMADTGQTNSDPAAAGQKTENSRTT